MNAAPPVWFVPLASLPQAHVGQLAPGAIIPAPQPFVPAQQPYVPIGVLETPEQQRKLIERLPYADALKEVTPALIATGIAIGLASGLGSTVGTAVGSMIVEWFQRRSGTQQRQRPRRP